MGCGLMQIVVYGAEDIFLTGNPEITFYKAVYRRHTNFVTELKSQHLIGEANFGQDLMSVIDKSGDLLGKVYLEINIPEINLKKTNPTFSTISKENIQEAFQEIKRLHQLMISYLDSNVDVARKLYALAKINNIPLGDIITACNNTNLISKLVCNRTALMDFLETICMNPSILHQKSKFFEELAMSIPQFDAVIRTLNLINNPSENKNDIASRKKLLDLLSRDLYESMRFFYLKIYEIYQNLKNINENQENYKSAWVQELGHSIIDTIEIQIGNNRIDCHTGDWLIIYDKLYGDPHHQDNYQKMIGNVPELTEFNSSTKPAYKLIIPFRFWFCRYMGSAVPLVALKYHDIMFNIRLKSLEDVFYTEDVTFPRFNESGTLKSDMSLIQSTYNINLGDVKLYTEYIFLDTPERRLFAKSTHEYLIETLQYDTIEDVLAEQFMAHLDFSNPTKFVVWFVQPKTYRENLTGDNPCLWNRYDIDGINPMSKTALGINNHGRLRSELNVDYYNYIQPYWHFSKTPPPGLNVYSFSLRPMEHQPSSSINFSRVDDFTITVKLRAQLMAAMIEKAIYFAAYAVSYNILRIIGGMAGLAFLPHVTEIAR